MAGFGDGDLASYTDDEIEGIDAGMLGQDVRQAVVWHQRAHRREADAEASGKVSAARSDGWDLHCHTVFSDGHCTPSQALQEAKDAGLAGIAITDHDSAAGWPEARAASQSVGEPVIRGTEVTAQWRTIDGPAYQGERHYPISVHLLAWLYDPDNPQLSALFARTRENRISRTRRMVELLSKDYPITWEDVLAQAGKGGSTTIGRPHIADALVAAGVFPDRNAAFQGPISSGSPYYIPVSTPSADEVIRAVKQAGGVIAVAHPASYSRNPVILTDADIRHLAALGLDGLEVWHRENSPEQRVRLIGLANRLGLLATGGSDWHGRHGKPNRLGENQTDPRTVGLIVARGAIPVIR